MGRCGKDRRRAGRGNSELFAICDTGTELVQVTNVCDQHEPRPRHARPIVACMAAGAVAAIGNAATQSWITSLTGDDEQGTGQGALAGISAIAETAVPVAATAFFAWPMRIPMPGLVLIVAAAFAIAAAVAMSRAPQPQPVSNDRSRGSDTTPAATIDLCLYNVPGLEY